MPPSCAMPLSKLTRVRSDGFSKTSADDAAGQSGAPGCAALCAAFSRAASASRCDSSSAVRSIRFEEVSHGSWSSEVVRSKVVAVESEA